MDFQIYEISIIPIIIFLTNVIINVGIPKKFSPLISLLFGITFGIAYFSKGNILKGILVGIFMGASATGFYSGSKNVYQEVRILISKKKE